MTENAGVQAAVAPGAPRRRRRWLRRGAWIVVGVALALVLVVFVLPSPLARYLIASQLDELGVKYEGLGTVDVDLQTRSFTAGPIAMRGDDGEPARLGSVEANYSLANLLKRRAFIETFVIRGVDIMLRRSEDGAFSINGVELQTATAEPQEDEAEGKGFGYGANTVIFADSLLTLEDYGGGRLTLGLDRLELNDFRSWAPDAVGRYNLNATLNGMNIHAQGEATPFAETKSFKGELALDSLTLDGLAAFVGPTGLTRQAGSHSLNVRHTLTLTPDGAARIVFEGTALTENADIGAEAGESIAIAAIEKQFDADIAISPDNAVDIGGAISLQIRDLSVVGADGARIALPEASLTLTEMNLHKSAALNEGMATTAVDGPRAARRGGRAPTLVQLALRGLIAVGREALRHRIEGDAAIALAAKGAEAKQPDGARVAFASGEISSSRVEVASRGAFWLLDAPLSAALSGIEARDGAAVSRIGRIEADIRAVKGETDFIDRSLAFDLALTLRELSARQGEASAAVNALSLGSDRIAFAGRTGAETLEAAMTIKAQGIEATSGGASAVKARLKAMTLALGRLRYNETNATATVDGRLDLADATGEAEGASFGADAIGLKMRGVAVKLAPEVTLSGAADLSGSKIAARRDGVAGTLGEIEARAENLRLTEEGIEASGLIRLAAAAFKLDGETVVNATVSSADASGLSVKRTKDGAMTVAAKAIQLADAAAQSDGETGFSGSVARVDAAGLLAAQRNDGAASVTVETVRLDGGSGKLDGGAIASATFGPLNALGLSVQQAPDGAPSVAVETIALEGLVGAASIALFADDASPRNAAARSQLSPAVRVGRITVAPGARITLNDASAGEALRLPLEVRRFDVGPIDTATPSASTAVDLSFAVADKAAATLTGKAAALATPPSFDLAGRLSDFPLPLVSPYVKKFTGLTVESGELNAAAAGKTTAGALAGKVDLRLAEFYVGKPDEATAKQFQDAYGVSVDFAVGVLKNRKGVIDLTLPVAGTVAAPKVDYADVISKAIGGALASLFPSGAVKGEAGFGVEPIPFEPGAIALDDAGRAAADRIAGVLASKPSIRIRVCGKAGRADLIVIRALHDAALDIAKPAAPAAPAPSGPNPAPVAPTPVTAATDAEAKALLAMAQERGSALRDHLASKGVAAERIGDCRTSYSVESDAPPRAEVQL